MKKIILTIIFLLYFISGYCATYNEVKNYLHKNVLITYKDAGEVRTDYGNLLTFVENKDDHTFDKIYTYVVLLNYKEELVTIKIDRIIQINQKG